MKRIYLPIVAAFAALTITSCGGQQVANDGTGRETVEMSGAGATFPLPFYTMTFESYSEKIGDKVSYGGIGSGGGIRNLKDEIVDFAGTDAFLTDEEMKDMNPVVHVPTCMGAVVIAYNLPEVKELNLSGEVIADIFCGKISKWDDPRLKELNPQAALPAKDIIQAYRSDGSGTTFIFTDYLSKVSEEWKSSVGTGKALKWPTGLAAKGNPGVAGTVSQTPGAIGYVGSEYAFALKMPMAQMRNSAGNFIVPTTESISAAASGEIPADTRTMITNPPAAEAYPISCFTWIILYQEQGYANRTQEQAKATVALLNWMLSPEAQALTTKVHSSPLPQSAINNANALLNSITFNGQKLQ